MVYKLLIILSLIVIATHSEVNSNDSLQSIRLDTASASLHSNDTTKTPSILLKDSSAMAITDTLNQITIEGIVIDSASGTPLKGDSVIVSCGKEHVHTDSTGAFSLQTKAQSSYSIDISAPSYQSHNVLFTGSKLYFFLTCKLSHVRASQKRENTGVPALEISRVPWTISGCIIDSKLDLPIKKVAITLTFDSTLVQVSKQAAFRVQTSVGGKHIFKVSAPGYQDVVLDITLDKTDIQPFVTIATARKQDKIKRREITVTAKREPLHSTATVSETKITRAEAINAAATTNDPIRVLQTLPGVASQSDMSARPVVRGGEVLESRAFLDGIPLIQPYHFGGARSTFNQLAMDRIDFYKSGFPARYENAQSAIIAVESRKPYLSMPTVDLDLNFLQGDLYAGIPLVKDRMGLSFSFQGAWQDFMMKRVMQIMANNQEDESVKKDINFLKDNINLPDYRDGSVGLGMRLNDKAELFLSESFNSDVCIFKSKSYSDVTNKMNAFTETSSIDTAIDYKSYSNVLYGVSKITPNPTTLYTVALAWQKRWWDLHIPDIVQPLGKPTYDVSIDQWNAHSGWLYSGAEKHLIHAGVQLDYTRARYNVNLVRAIHQLIIEGSTNLGDYFGPMTGDSGTASFTGGLSDLVGTGPILGRLLLRYHGTNSFLNTGVYFEDEWTPSSRLTVNLGGRLEFSTADLALDVSPRFSVKCKLNDKHEFIGALGHYTQNNYELAALALSDELKPEKVWHASVGEEWRLLPWLTQKVELFGKYYFDLGSEIIELNYKGIVDSLLNNPFLNGDTTANSIDQNFYSTTPESLLFGDQIYYTHYVNKGRGLAGGLEWFLRYDPADFWDGWLSLTFNTSYRQRLPGWKWHPFPIDRPILFSIVNFYRLPRSYEISVKYRYMSGIPYTAISLSDSTLPAIGPYNKERYGAYQRLDVKFSKGFELMHKKGHAYIEVWDALNTPNFLLVDKKSRVFRSLDLNWPVTCLFLGLDFSF